MEEFKGNKSENTVIHWDSKLVDDAHGTKLERLALLVSGTVKGRKGVVFDTTASNSGVRQGSCKRM